MKLGLKVYFLLIYFSALPGKVKSNSIDFINLYCKIEALDTLPIIVIDTFGRLGIGNQIPTERLDINGNVKITGALMPEGNAGENGAFLMSRGSGQAPLWATNFIPGKWTEGTNKIYYNIKDVEIGKTLINLADHSESQYTIFQKWLPNSSTTPNLPPFTFTGGEFVNPMSGQPNNYTHNFGINLDGGGGPLVSGRPAAGLSFENQFYIDNVPYMEFHILAVDNTGLQRRPLTTINAFDGSRNDWSNFLSRMNLHDKDGAKQIYQIDTETEIWNYNGNGLRHVFNTPNYQPIWQNINDGTGNPFPLIGYLGNSHLDRRLQLGNPNSPIPLRMGSTLDFGHVNGFDFLGSAMGDGSTSLRLGTEGKRFSTIELNTSYGIVASFKNTSNLMGWGLGLNSPGALYFIDFTSNTTPFYLSTSMPDNAFRMYSNGNLSLNGDDASEKLVINGNLKVKGALMPNGQAGTSEEVLVSQGNNTPPIWEKRIKNRYEENFIAMQNQSEFIINSSIEEPFGNALSIEVYINGIKLKRSENILSTRNFNYLNNVITTSNLTAGDEVDIVYFR